VLETAAVRSRLPALTVLALLVLLGVPAVVLQQPPAPRPASAPAGEFSAERAIDLLGGIAAQPHPVGSPAQAEVRGYLLERLRGLGLDPRASPGLGATSGPAPAQLGPVVNIHARLPGTAPTGRVLLVAHYDSVPIGPGASDDGANVAAVLEVLRALSAGPALRNDVEVLFTDGGRPACSARGRSWRPARPATRPARWC
jgi:acetylornithine deacetylase/succinyl-diaminopimelate desuccinylase-like protein